MKEAGLSVFYIQGQHDYSDPPWPDALCDTVKWVHNQVFEPEPGVKVFALDHMKHGMMKPVLEKELPKDCHMVMLHQLARQVFPLEGTYDFDAAWLPDHVTTAIMGDYHQPVEFAWGKENLGFYTGSMHVQAIDEPKDKSFILAEQITRKDGLPALSIQRIPLVTRLYFKYPINSEEELDALVRWVNNYDVEAEALARGILWDAIKCPVVEVPHLTSVKDVKSRLEEASGNKVHLWFKPFHPDVQQGPVTVTDVKTRASLEGCLGTYVKADSEDHGFILELLSKPSDIVFGIYRKRLGIDPEEPAENLVLEVESVKEEPKHA